jgi:ADP-heptose:LPS heptosyltransferase
MKKKKSTLDRWCLARHLINFKVFLHIGGGLGDVIHRYKDSEYLRVLKSLKEFFPNLYVYLYLHGKNVKLSKQLFETVKEIDEIIIVPQQLREFDWSHIEKFLLNICHVNKEQMAKCMPEIGAETVFRRVINRIYPLIKFPRIRAISMDDFFQQMNLNTKDFIWELAEVKTTIKDDEIAQTRINNGRVYKREIVGIHPFTQDVSRNCYPIEKWKELINALITKKYAVAIFGSPEEGIPYRDILSIPYVVDLTKEIGLRPKISVLKKCAGCITIDSSIMHLSWLHAIPTVSIIEKYNNWGSSFTTDVNGYHWAAIAKEPFASRIISRQREAKGISTNKIIEEFEKIKNTKGLRLSNAWRDQC